MTELMYFRCFFFLLTFTASHLLLMNLEHCGGWRQKLPFSKTDEWRFLEISWKESLWLPCMSQGLQCTWSSLNEFLGRIQCVLKVHLRERKWRWDMRLRPVAVLLHFIILAIVLINSKLTFDQLLLFYNSLQPSHPLTEQDREWIRRDNRKASCSECEVVNWKRSKLLLVYLDKIAGCIVFRFKLIFQLPRTWHECL